MPKTLYDKVFDRHVVRKLSDEQYQIFIGLHLVHELTSPQAFEALRERQIRVGYPKLTFATVDHSVPTNERLRPYSDPLSEEQIVTLERNVEDFGIRYFSKGLGEQGILHVIAPEQGLTQPGITIACGDSHTSTHGAFGALAFGIGTSQLRDVLATQTLLVEKAVVRRIEVRGKLSLGVYAKDMALHILGRLGARAGIGFAYEFAGDVIERMSMDERMTLCNMAVEGGARCGYVNPDATTYAYLAGRKYAPSALVWERAVADWNSIRSDADASYADVLIVDAEDIEPMITWGISPDQAMPVTGKTPDSAVLDAETRAKADEAFTYMGLCPGQTLLGTKIDVAFIGSCTNGRLSDFEAVADLLTKSGGHVAPHVKALAVPGSQQVRQAMVERGLDRIFIDAGFEFRDAGCSLCVGLNADKLQGRQVCASSSNRNFKGRQGSPEGRTLLMSPVMVAAAAIYGEVADVRRMLQS